MNPDQTNNLTPEELKKLKRKEYLRKYTIENEARIKQARHDYYLKNKEILSANKKIYNELNKEKIKARRKIYKLENKETIAEKNKIYYEENKEEILIRGREWYNKVKDTPEYKDHKKSYRNNHKEHIKLRSDNHYKKNKSEILKRQKEDRINNPEKYKEKSRCDYISRKDKIKRYALENRKRFRKRNSNYKKNRRKIDILYKLSEDCRSRIYAMVKYGFTKNKRSETLLGTTFELFKPYFQSKFNQYMTWPHFMAGLIHIDHIIPLSSATTQEEVEKLCHYTNLQPLWATTAIAREHGDMFSIGNLEKGDR